MSEISLRLKEIVNYTGLSDRAFAQSIDLAQTTFTNILLKGTEPKSDVLRAIIEKYKINAHWLLTGEGEMFTKTESEKVPCVKDVMVPVLSQKASCGPGVEWNSEQNITEYISLASLSPALSGNVYGFRVAGTSMLGAGIKDGDIVELYNDRGSVLCAASVTHRVPAGVLHSYGCSAKYDPIEPGTPGSTDRAGCVNLLTASTMLSKNAPGMTPNSCLCEIRVWEGK